MTMEGQMDEARLRAEALQDARMCLRRAQSAIAAASASEADRDRLTLLGSAHASIADALVALDLVMPR